MQQVDPTFNKDETEEDTGLSVLNINLNLNLNYRQLINLFYVNI